MSSSISVIDDIYDVLKTKGLDYKHDSSNTEIIVKSCPFCMDSKEHLYVHVGSPEKLGLFDCKKCQASGHWEKLRKALLGEEGLLIQTPYKFKEKEAINSKIEAVLAAHKRLLSDPETMRWLLDRNISVDSMQKYKLGVLHYDKHPEFGENVKVLAIPHFFRNNLMNVKFRSLPPAKKNFSRIPGGASILFNYDNIDHEKNYIYITEGELDAISLVQAGETNVVGITAGARSFIPDWFDLLKEFNIVYLVLDNDRAGQDGAEYIADRLGRDRCYNILLPNDKTGIKDVNDYFKDPLKYDFADFKSLALKATKFNLPTIYSLETVFTEIISRLEEGNELIEGLKTPWESLNDKMGVMAKSDLIYLSGKPKSSKTTAALQICYNLAYNQNIPCLLFCLEMPPRRLAAKLVSLHRLQDQNTVALEDVMLARTDLQNKQTPLYFGYTADRKYLNADSLFKVFENAKKKYGIELLVFDNLHYLSRDIAHTTQEISKISRDFKLMAMNLNMQIIVIVQPRKMDDNAVMTSTHLKDSSAMEADADTVLILHRNKLPNVSLSSMQMQQDSLFSPIVNVTVDRTRYAQGGYTTLYLEGAKSYLREATQNEVEQYKIG